MPELNENHGMNGRQKMNWMAVMNPNIGF